MLHVKSILKVKGRHAFLLLFLVCLFDLCSLFPVGIKNNSNIMIKYHPKFWTEGIYQCCRQTEKLAPGCEKYNLFENSKYVCSYVKWCWHMIMSSHLNAVGCGEIYRAGGLSHTVPRLNQNIFHLQVLCVKINK